MALSWSEQILPAGALTVPVEMDYLDRSYIHLYLNDVEVNDFTWDSDTLIRFGAALVTSTKVTVVRRTARDYLYILFAEGAAFIKENLDTQNTQFLHLAQELVEGRAIDGFFGEINMNGYRITNLAPGVAPTDAANTGQLQAVSDRVTSLEQSVSIDTSAYPWYVVTSSEVTSVAPPFTFTKAAVYINGVCQTPGYSYDVINNVIHLAEPVPAGTHIFARLGEDVPNEQGYATAASLAAVAVGKLDVAANAVSATKLATARTIQTNLGNTTAASFDGTGNVTPGVTGVLAVANGGTGGSTAAAARASLGAAASGANSDITSLTGLTGGITGITSGSAVDTGVVGQVLTAVSPASVTFVSAASINVASITLPAGVWSVSGTVQSIQSTGTSSTATAGLATTTGVLPTLWYQKYVRGAAASGTVTAGVPSVLVNSSTSITLYLVGNITFTGGAGTCTGLGYISALRIR